MNLKKTFVSFMAAGAVLAGGFAGAAAQDATLPLTVDVTNEGVFSVEFCEGDGAFAPVTLDSENSLEEDRTTITNTVICYTDTQAHRGQYTASLSAGDFTGTDADNVIGNENLTLGVLSIMNSGQWGSHVGAIAAIDGGGNSIGSDPAVRSAEWIGEDFSTGPLHVHNIWPGAGTAGEQYIGVENPATGEVFVEDPRSTAGSWQEVELKLVVPVDAADDNYSSTLTIDVTSADGP